MSQRKIWTGQRLAVVASLTLSMASACGTGDVTGADGDVAATDGAPATPDAASVPDAALEPFSFFVSSLEIMRELSGSEDGFGGDLGGLAGADAICQEAAARVGGGGKTWRAFLSVTAGPGGGPVNAIDRIGDGPWYDRHGRLVALDRAGLQQVRPDGDAQIADDLPNERGETLRMFGDTHDVMTGSNEQGRLESTNPVATCQDWTSAVGPGSEKMARCGHSWPAMSGQHWIRAHRLPGCSPGVNIMQTGMGEGDCVGCGGGWGAIYCFALTP
jgi:hypothetical protein